MGYKTVDLQVTQTLHEFPYEYKTLSVPTHHCLSDVSHFKEQEYLGKNHILSFDTTSIV